MYLCKEDFEKGRNTECEAFPINRVSGYVFGAPKNENSIVYKWQDERAKEVEVQSLLYKYEESKWGVVGCEVYPDMESVYKVHDYVVKHADGTEEVRVSPKNKIALTEEQRKVA